MAVLFEILVSNIASSCCVEGCMKGSAFSRVFGYIGITS